ncbi:uncharacterized protein Z518_03071 [Rhinocladiella mackenziei CBS 650.93]|uniref:Uncharacterized protein n=1 Tax=Rhinocladiella mackenziei CBS 650.93 TaxID=1442369 RepID=A0A0D2JGF2_9EURO|nr:uncharacterized protein Z518_03071 [Rhinocladiella mackenziei CBS 650.93]KIX08415.1 hypothetical protein Z518_03071 [Rhinocladiella mackenziei CBS 650.93]
MARDMDAHSSFLYLVENLPSWQATIDSLSVHAAQKNAEFGAEYARLVNQIRPKRRKTPSVASIHTHDAESPIESPTTSSNVDDVASPSDRVDINPLDAENRCLYVQARRKRKPDQSLRSGASGPPQFRNKNQVVVYYDGYLQEQLDSMVKLIGVGRNNLRKGKNALAAAKGFRLPTLTTRSGQGYPSLENIKSTMISRNASTLLQGKQSRGPRGQPASDDETAFFQVDKQLEIIQSLCETAAHQFLRDGDCRTELDSIHQKFDLVLEQAKTTAESLKKLRGESRALSQDGTDNQGSIGSDHNNNNNNCAHSDTTISTQPSMEGLKTPKIGAAPDPSPLILSHTMEDMKSRGALFRAPEIPPDTTAAVLMADTIEVDDASDQSSIEVDISQYRLTSPRRAVV